MPETQRSVTETEFAILDVLWQDGPATVRQIVEAIYDKHTHSLHASVRSLLERLADKAFVTRERQGAVDLFSATLAREAFVAQQMQMLADSNFGGSLAPLLLTLVDNVKLSRKDRDAIHKIVQKIEATQTAE